MSKSKELKKLLLDTNETYYWIGFILADGTITNNLTRLGIGLSLKDEKHLEKLRIFLNYKRKLRKFEKNQAIILAIMDKQLVPQICQKFDIKPNKTYNPPRVSILEKFSDSQFLSFLIGYIDGDGCITKTSQKRRGAQIGFHCHKSWKLILQYINQRTSKIVGTNLSKIGIDKYGYINFGFCNSLTTRFLKIKALKLRLPILNRKWDNVDINFLSHEAKGILNKGNVLTLSLVRIKNKIIAQELNLSIGAVKAIKHRFIREVMPNVR